MAKVGRNQPCPCGSGKKYKKCHGVDAQASALNEVARIGFKWINMMVEKTLAASEAKHGKLEQQDRLHALNLLCQLDHQEQVSEIELQLEDQILDGEDEVDVDAADLEGAQSMTESGELREDVRLASRLHGVDLMTTNRRDRRLFSQLKLSLSQSIFEPYEVLEVLRGSGFKVKGCFSGRILQINQAQDATELEPMEWIYGRVLIFGRRAYLLEGWEKLKFRSRKALKAEVAQQANDEKVDLNWLRKQASWLLERCHHHQQPTQKETSA